MAKSGTRTLTQWLPACPKLSAKQDKQFRVGSSMIDQVRKLLSGHPMIPVDIGALADDANLYDAGLTSFASVQMMLALEEEFDMEFPEAMLTRRTFSSLANIADAVAQLTRKAA
jgi:acyl carrier protein